MNFIEVVEYRSNKGINVRNRDEREPNRIKNVLFPFFVRLAISDFPFLDCMLDVDRVSFLVKLFDITLRVYDSIYEDSLLIYRRACSNSTSAFTKQTGFWPSSSRTTFRHIGKVHKTTCPLWSVSDHSMSVSSGAEPTGTIRH